MTVEGAAGSARMAGEERRLQILAVAVSLFSNRGFRGTTTKEIAQAAGVSEAMVFRHFATKEELYAAILDHKACSGGKFEPAEMAADGIKRKDDRAVFESLALGALQPPRKRSRVSAFAASLRTRETRARANVLRRVCSSRLRVSRRYIRERQREGALIEMDPAIVVRCVYRHGDAPLAQQQSLGSRNAAC